MNENNDEDIVAADTGTRATRETRAEGNVTIHPGELVWLLRNLDHPTETAKTAHESPSFYAIQVGFS